MHIDVIRSSKPNDYLHDQRSRMAPPAILTASQASGLDVDSHLQAVVPLPVPDDSSTAIQGARDLIAAGQLDHLELIRQAAVNLLANGI